MTIWPNYQKPHNFHTTNFISKKCHLYFRAIASLLLLGLIIWEILSYLDEWFLYFGYLTVWGLTLSFIGISLLMIDQYF